MKEFLRTYTFLKKDWFTQILYTYIFITFQYLTLPTSPEIIIFRFLNFGKLRRLKFQNCNEYKRKKQKLIYFISVQEIYEVRNIVLADQAYCIRQRRRCRSMKSPRNDDWVKNTEVFGKKLRQYHFQNHKLHLDCSGTHPFFLCGKKL
jgi:hypothetical protein